MMRVLAYVLLFVSMHSFGQANKGKTDKDLAKGNSEFVSNDYVDAEASYRISRSKSPTKAAAAYNLGNSIYRQGGHAEAAYAYANAIKNARTKQQKHMAYHNLGNIFMKEKDYSNAVEAYKNALRNDPTDEQSRYNFALAKEMLKNNPPPPQKNNEDKDKKDQNKDKNQQPNGGGGDKNQPPKDPKDKGDNKDKGGDGDQKDKGDKGDQKQDKGNEGDKQDKGDQGGRPKPEEGPSPSKQRMENLLDAMNNEEKKIQNKIQGKKVRVRPTKQEKDW